MQFKINQIHWITVQASTLCPNWISFPRMNYLHTCFPKYLITDSWKLMFSVGTKFFMQQYFVLSSDGLNFQILSFGHTWILLAQWETHYLKESVPNALMMKLTRFSCLIHFPNNFCEMEDCFIHWTVELLWKFSFL